MAVRSRGFGPGARQPPRLVGLRPESGKHRELRRRNRSSRISVPDWTRMRDYSRQRRERQEAVSHRHQRVCAHLRPARRMGGLRNPVHYTSLAKLPIRVDDLDFQSVPTHGEVSAGLNLGALLAETKVQLARALQISPASIEIVVRT